MVQNYTFSQVHDAAVCGFNALYVIARNDVRHVWRYMTRPEQRLVARGLVDLRRFGKNVDQNLSRATTAKAWRARAEKYAASYNLSDICHIYSIVPTPTMVAQGNIPSALVFRYGDGEVCGSAERKATFDALAGEYMMFDYACNGEFGDKSVLANSGAQKNARRVVQLSNDLQRQAAEIQARKSMSGANSIKQIMLDFVYDFIRPAR